jgi:hypothetical protein
VRYDAAVKTLHFLVLMLVACGGGSSNPIDAAIQPDALIDAPAPPPGAHRYVVDHVKLPSTNTEAKMYGLDLNNDGMVDNQLGMVLGTLSGMGVNSQLSTDHAVDSGAILQLADLDALDLTTEATAMFTLYDGAHAMPAPCNGASDPTCRHHLAGTATFDLATTSAHDTPLAGAIAAGVFTAGPGQLHVQAALFGGAPVVLTLIGARVKITGASEASVTSGVVAGGLSQSEIDGTLIPALQHGATAVVAADCTALTSPPACGCASGSSGKTVIGLLDANHDCAVSNDEIKNNALFMSLLAPDVTINNQPALSMGIGITAVHAAFTP